MSAVLLILPDFALILLGASVRRFMHLGDHFWGGVEKLVYFILFPALLFSGLVRTRIDWAAAAPLIACAAAAMAVGALLGTGLRAFRLPTQQYASLHQCAFRFNSYVGLAIASSLHGAPGVAAMAMVVGVMVPPANALAVWVLARHGEHNVWRELARNPLIIGTVSGLAANLAGLELPAPALKLLARLGDAAVALGLLAVGAGLRLGTVAPRAAAPNAYLLTVKLLAMPLVAWGLAGALDLPTLYAQIAVLFAALPTASSAFILAQRMGGDGASVAWQISVSTLLAMLSMPLWVSLAT